LTDDFIILFGLKGMTPTNEVKEFIRGIFFVPGIVPPSQGDVAGVDGQSPGRFSFAPQLASPHDSASSVENLRIFIYASLTLS
jgi:hypothetical protein